MSQNFSNSDRSFKDCDSKIQNRMACLWLPHWAIQRMVVARPELRCQRLVLFYQDPRRGRLVTAVSPLAMQAGVRVAMPLSEAQSLLQRAGKVTSRKQEAPGVGTAEISGTAGAFSARISMGGTAGSGVESDLAGGESFFILEHDPAADLLALTELADSLSRFSPIIGLEQMEVTNATGAVPPTRSRRSSAPPAASVPGSFQPASILLEITGLQRLFGGEKPLARELFQFIQSLDYLPRLAIANTVGLAWGASRFATHAATPWLIIAADDRETPLQLPIESLRLSAPTVRILHQLGIRFNAQLWQLPRSELAMRFGDEIHRRIDQVTGQLPEPVIARPQTAEMVASQLLEYPTQHQETIEVIIARLLAELCQLLRGRQQGGLQWLITLRLVDEPPLQLNVSLFQATATESEIMPLIAMQLEHQLGQPHKSKRNKFQVQEVRVAVGSSVLLVPYQRPLFDEAPQLNRQALAQLINRLTSRLGQPQVVYPQLLSGAQPEFSYRFRPLVDIHRRRRTAAKKLNPQSHRAGRPLRIFHPARELSPLALPKSPSSTAASSAVLSSASSAVLSSVLSSAAASAAGSQEPAADSAADTFSGSAKLVRDNLLPQVFHQHDAAAGNPPTITVLQATGPERIETGWWRGPTICRDYWRVETEEGQSLWIYRDLRSKRWFLQGEF